MTITIPGEFTSLNEINNANRSHWSKGAKIKKDETNLIAWHIKGKKPISGPHAYEFVWYCNNKKKDPDNIASACKFIFDGFVDGGLIKNDGWGEVVNIKHYFKIDKNNPRVEITIIPTI